MAISLCPSNTLNFICEILRTDIHNIIGSDNDLCCQEQTFLFEMYHCSVDNGKWKWYQDWVTY